MNFQKKHFVLGQMTHAAKWQKNIKNVQNRMAQNGRLKKLFILYTVIKNLPTYGGKMTKFSRKSSNISVYFGFRFNQ